MKNLQLQSIIAIFIALLLAACSRWEPEICNNGLRCPRGCTADRNHCIAESCGNYAVDPEEECDDGNNDSGDACNNDCTKPICGDGLISKAIGEQCEGSLSEGRLCGPTCLWAACGNGIIDPDEICDDSNNVSGDKCSADCRSDEKCGNQIIDITEVCDDGDNDAGDGCSFACQSDETCGNGIKDDGEDCDCGEGMTMPNPNDPESIHCGTEQNSDDPGYCRRDCIRHCGDGKKAGNEQCDVVDSSTRLFCTTEEGYDMGTFQCNSCLADLLSCTDLAWNDISPPKDELKSNDKPRLAGILGVRIDDNRFNLFAFGSAATVLRYNGTDKWDDISPQGSHSEDLVDLWISNEEVFAVGKRGSAFSGALIGGRLQEFEVCDRTVPAECEQEKEEDFASIWGVTDPNLNIFLLQADGDILHYRREDDSEQWRHIAAPEGSYLNDIWGSTLNRFFAVGRDGKVFHLLSNEGRWVPVTLDIESDVDDVDLDVDEDLLSIWGSPNGGIFVVGKSGIILRKSNDDPGDTRWQKMSAPTTSTLFSVWGGGPNDVFAAGRDGTLLHFDGFIWAPVRPPNLPESNASEPTDLKAVWSTAQDISIVSEHGDIFYTSRKNESIRDF